MCIIKEIVKNSTIIDAPLNQMTEANLMYLNLLADLDMMVLHLQDTFDEATKTELVSALT